MPFVKVTDDALLEEARTSPEFVLIPSNNRLEILVEHGCNLTSIYQLSLTYLQAQDE
jgi:hypothetical protein